MIVLTGRSASGKTHIQKELSRVCGMKRVVTYTTRPMRSGETNGVEYHFVSKEEFLEMKSRGLFAETTQYAISKNTTWYYGTSKESLKEENGVIICNPDGLKYLRQQPELDLTVFYINASEEVIRDRLIKRGDHPEEAERRLAADNEDFKDIDNYYNYAIENNGRKSPTILAEEICLMYKTEKKLLEDLHDRQNSN